jgi:hypothetical protein
MEELANHWLTIIDRKHKKIRFANEHTNEQKEQRNGVKRLNGVVRGGNKTVEEQRREATRRTVEKRDISKQQKRWNLDG